MTRPDVARRRPELRVRPFRGEADVERSAELLQAAGFALVPLARPVGPWDLVATSSQGLPLVAVIHGHDWPELGGVQLYRVPPGWPIGTRRLLHLWGEQTPLPLVLGL